MVTRPRGIRLTRASYELLEQEARQRGFEPDALAEELLRADLGDQARASLDAALARLGELRPGPQMAPPDADIPAVMSARTRRWTDASMIALAVAAAASTQIEAGSPVRAVLVLAAFLLVPGWGLVSLLSSGPPAAMLGLALGLSVAIDVAGSLVLVWTGHFDVLVLTGIVGAVAVLLALADLVRQSQSHSPRDETSASRAAG